MDIQRPKSKQPLPEHAKLAFKGIMFDTYQWEVTGYDGKKKIFEKLKRPDTVLIIPVTEDGKIILALQEQPGKSPSVAAIGGRVDGDENILDAAKRELLEETGYEATDWELFHSEQPVTKIEWAVYMFIARGCKKATEQDLDGAEKIELKFLSFDEFVDLIVSDDKFEAELRIKVLEAKLYPQKMQQLNQLLLK